MPLVEVESLIWAEVISVLCEGSMVKKILKKFLGVNQLEDDLTKMDEELQDSIRRMDCVEVSVEDRAYEYDLESLRENVIELEQKIEELEGELKSLEEA